MALSSLVFAVSAATLFTFTLAADRNIPATDDNQEYFSTTQALFALGKQKYSSCGSDLAEIEACIKDCNSPGLQERSGCCCVAFPSREFFIGIRGGCRYRQQLLNFTTSLMYVSKPIGGARRYFDETTCAPSNKNPTDAECKCSIIWELSTEALEMTSPLPTPTPSLSPGASPSNTPSASPSMVTPEPTESPLVESPTPEPMPSVVPPPVPSEIPPTETPEPSNDVPGPIMTDEGPSPSDDEGTPGPDETPGETDGEPTEPVETEDESPTDESPTEEEDDGGICVEESHLVEMGIPRAHMVHTTGIKARVLCPPGSLPCGTFRHKLRRQGVSMSYKRYCREFVTCEERMAVVNSVYTHLWEETQHDDDVTLTMYDVSYPESAQVVLHSVMSAGRRAMRRLKRASYLA